MVQAIINISDQANQILNIIKAKYGLNDKSEAINVLAKEYGEELLEPELRPDYVKKALKIKEQVPIIVGTIGNLRSRYK